MSFAELTPDQASRFADIALGHVRREYPNYIAHVVSGPPSAMAPSELHPVFYGSFDWHSCVHGYWLLARLLRRYPDLPVAGRIEALFDEQLRPEKVEVERTYFDEPGRRSFERPYGWAWLLKLAVELRGLADDRWSEALAPLAEQIAEGFRSFLPLATYPIRTGTHGNTAFALRLAADYAEATSDAALTELLRTTALRWYAADADCPAWGEPSGNDFLSPALIEATCMRRLLSAESFLPWFERFLPRIGRREPATLFEPATVSDRSDGQIAHLDGLNLSRAWCWRSLAKALPQGDERGPLLGEVASAHLAAALPHVAGDYAGEHWLASFAVLAIDEAA